MKSGTSRSRLWGAVRVGDYKYVLIDQPQGWFGTTNKINMPQVYNLRLDPFERMSYARLVIPG